MNKLKNYITLALKGAGMGAANVIPGVSGGTVALITGIFEKLINSIKAFDIKALQLLLKFKFKEFASHVNLSFLVAIFFGVAVSIISLARVLEFLFVNYPVYIWAYFFGLILASIYFVGKTVSNWNVSVIITFLIGTAIALSMAFLSPATENDGFIYMIICGVVAICSMILPGLSGSFVLILMGNYQLILKSVNNLDFTILLPVVVGAGVGLVAFSHLLSWIYKKFRDQTISTLTGFILGSLIILWPWKRSFNADGAEILTNKFGAFISANGEILEEVKVYGYEEVLPESLNGVVGMAIVWIIIGFISIWLMEKFAGDTEKA